MFEKLHALHSIEIGKTVTFDVNADLKSNFCSDSTANKGMVCDGEA